MLHPRVGGTWLADVGTFGEVSYSESFLHGCESARWAMRSGTRHRALRPGAEVFVYEGTMPVWQGIFTEGSSDGTMDAVGSWTRGSGVLALDSTGNPNVSPETVVNAAISRSALPWRLNVAPLSTDPIGEQDAALTVTGLLDRYSANEEMMWRINHYGVVETLAWPTTPKWGVIIEDDLWSMGNDDYVTHLNVVYLSAVGVQSYLMRTTAESVAAADLWGRKEDTFDLTFLGVISAAAAQRHADAVLKRTGPRMVLTEGIVLNAGQLRTIGDSAAGWARIHAGQMLRLWGRPDRSKTTITLHTDMVIGHMERTQSLSLSPQGLPATNARDVIAELSR